MVRSRSRKGHGLECPDCGKAEGNDIEESRSIPTASGTGILKNRRCHACGKRFQTLTTPSGELTYRRFWITGTGGLVAKSSFLEEERKPHVD